MKRSGIGLCAAVASALVLCAMPASGIETGIAAGGEVTIDGGFAVHAFKDVGESTFMLFHDVELDVLVVGGGGGGGNNGGGGGGAGGFLLYKRHDIACWQLRRRCR